MELPQVQNPGTGDSLLVFSEANKLIRPMRGLLRAEFSPAGIGEIIPGEEKWLFALTGLPTLPPTTTVVVFVNGGLATLDLYAPGDPHPLS